MPSSNNVMIKRLQGAINSKGYGILIERHQFYSDEQKRAVTIYNVYRSIPTKSGRRKKEKLFETTSMIQVVLYLRDVWYTVIYREIPRGNEVWENVKQKKALSYEWVHAKSEVE